MAFLWRHFAGFEGCLFGLDSENGGKGRGINPRVTRAIEEYSTRMSAGLSTFLPTSSSSSPLHVTLQRGGDSERHKLTESIVTVHSLCPTSLYRRRYPTIVKDSVLTMTL